MVRAPPAQCNGHLTWKIEMRMLRMMFVCWSERRLFYFWWGWPHRDRHGHIWFVPQRCNFIFHRSLAVVCDVVMSHDSSDLPPHLTCRARLEKSCSEEEKEMDNFANKRVGGTQTKTSRQHEWGRSSIGAQIWDPEHGGKIRGKTPHVFPFQSIYVFPVLYVPTPGLHLVVVSGL